MFTAVGHRKTQGGNTRRTQGETQAGRKGRAPCLCFYTNDAWPLFHTLLIVYWACMHILEQWWSSSPHVVLSLPSSGFLIMVRVSVSHTDSLSLSPACHCPNQFLAQMFLALKCQVPWRKPNDCLLISWISWFVFISFWIPKAVNKLLPMQLWK